MSIIYIIFSDDNLSNFKNSLQDIKWQPVLIDDNDANEPYDLFKVLYLLLLMSTSHFRFKIFQMMEKSKPCIITPAILYIASVRKKNCEKNMPKSRVILNRMSQAMKSTH